jgi:outer membrane protein assembly factor BamB
LAQFPGDWNTAGFDAQRSSWLKSDAKISLANMQTPGFELVWKMDLDKKSGAEYLTTPPVLLDFYISYRGFRTLGFVGGRDNRVIAIDTDLGRLEWEKNFDIPKVPAASSATCPGGMTASVSRRASMDYPPLTTPRGMGRGTPAKSGVGEPFEGAVTLKQAPIVRPAATKPKARPGRSASVPPSPFAPNIQWVHALSSDGKFHSLYVSNGEEPKTALPFLPPNAHARGLLVVEDNAYVATVNGCGGVENGIWSLNLQSGKVSHWKASASVAGEMGPAMGPDGTVYAAAGPELVALSQGTLAPKSSYKLPGAEFTSSPVIFEVKNKDFVAATSSDGKLHLFDTASLQKPVSTSAAFTAARASGGALASWQDQAGIRWILAPSEGNTAAGVGFNATNGQVTNGAIVAWKVVEQGGQTRLEPGWVSRDMNAPLAPIVVNGVVFAVSSGSKTKAPAVLYALDALTGRELWNSGKTITGYVTTGGLAAGGTRVYVAAQDGTQYVFGYPIEH